MLRSLRPLQVRGRIAAIEFRGLVAVGGHRVQSAITRRSDIFSIADVKPERETVSGHSIGAVQVSQPTGSNAAIPDSHLRVEKSLP
jgi:hypothetical protein